MKKYILFAILLVAIIGVLYWTTVHHQQTLISQSSTPTVNTSTDKLIAKLETAHTGNPSNVKASVALASAYLQKVRETADVAYYKKVDALMDAAAKAEPKNPDVIATQASVATGRHDFARGLVLGEQALGINPNRASYYGIVGDAHLELGRYPEAIADFQKMVDIRPDLSSFNRIAYIREIYGDIDGAEQVLTLAINSGSSFPENIAWSQVELGKLLMRSDLAKAKASFETALAIMPAYPPALEGLGKVAFFQNDPGRSDTLFQEAFDRLPIAAYALDLADTANAAGNAAKTAQYEALAKIAFVKSKASGVNTDLETSLFLADYDIDYPQALADAEAAYKIRPSIYVADARAWALYKLRRYDEAKRFSAEALRLGEHEPLLMFHAGMIELAMHNTSEAKRLLTKTLKIHPYFSLRHARDAAQTAAKL